MRFKYEKENHEWLCLINPYGDAWHYFGRGLTKKRAKIDALINWNDYNKQTGYQVIYY